ncbi:hypothetical protein STEG23_017948 [Scotinomys teguina]
MEEPRSRIPASSRPPPLRARERRAHRQHWHHANLCCGSVLKLLGKDVKEDFFLSMQKEFYGIRDWVFQNFSGLEIAQLPRLYCVRPLG